MHFTHFALNPKFGHKESKYSKATKIFDPLWPYFHNFNNKSRKWLYTSKPSHIFAKKNCHTQREFKIIIEIMIRK